MRFSLNDTICALSTPQGNGAIAVIRITGEKTFQILQQIFSKNLTHEKSHTIHFGIIKKENKIIDEVLISIFRNPNSFTGEDLAEISCHASPFIIREILSLLIEKGCEPATPGAFTMRAFLNKKMDLSQAEAVADLIASQNEAAHKLALQQVRGGFSKEILSLREQLIHFASMMELELDFSEEDVEFANRNEFLLLIEKLMDSVKNLADSFAYGNVIKNGIPVAIIGVPNVGKSTLLNAMLNENRALVSDIPGTTRDTIEDVINIHGIDFRFIDTAGLRETKDVVENMGIERTYDKIKKASILLYLVDAVSLNKNEIKKNVESIRQRAGDDKKLWVIVNKTDIVKKSKEFTEELEGMQDVIFISAKEAIGIEELKLALVTFIENNRFSEREVVVTNARHHAALLKALQSLMAVKDGLTQNISGDLVAVDIRKTLFHLGEITGDISTEDILGAIFSKFCIGK